MKIITLFILLATLTCNDLLAQIRLDVDGDGWIRKRLVMGNTDDKNMFIGHDAGINTTPRDPNPIQNGIENTFIGYQSGFKNTSGSYNTYLGVLAGSFNTTGSSNTFIGLRAGFSNTSGAANTFLGQSSGRSNTIGDFNTFIGTFAGGNNMSGTINTFIGYNSGGNNTIGKRNTFIGNWAGFNNNKGNRNTSIGSSSGSNNINGNYNTFLGWDANLLYSIDSLDRAIAIGYRAEVACHNCAVIGGTGLNAVKMGVATNMPLSDLHIKQSTDQLQVGGGIRLEDTADGDYWAVTIDQLNDYNFVFNGSVIGWIDSGTRMYIPNTSAFSEPNESTSRGRRSKKMQKVLKKVQQLQPLTQKIAGDNASEIWGFHSEEVAKLFPAITSEKNGQKGVIYNYFGVLSIKAIQELAVVVDQLN